MYHNTPQQDFGNSPAQRLFSRRTRTVLPISPKLLAPEVVDTNEVISIQQKRKGHQQKQYKSSTKPLSELQPGDRVQIQPQPGQGHQWTAAVVKKQLRQRTYTVTAANGSVLVRNRKFLRKVEQLPADKNPVTGTDMYNRQERDDNPQRRLTYVPMPKPVQHIDQNKDHRLSSQDSTHNLVDRRDPPKNCVYVKDRNLQDKILVSQNSQSSDNSLSSPVADKQVHSSSGIITRSMAKHTQESSITNSASTHKSQGFERPRRKCDKTRDKNFVYCK